jgi:hypothetical protein
LPGGIHVEQPGGATISLSIGDTNEWDDVDLVTDKTNGFVAQKINGFVVYNMAADSTNNMYKPLLNVFEQIKIKIGCFYDPHLAGSNHCAILIRPKP